MAYFKAYATTQYVGTDVHYRIEADNEEEALKFFHDTAVAHIDSYGFDEDSDEEDGEEGEGFEKEYNYNVVEVTKEEYDKLQYEILQ